MQRRPSRKPRRGHRTARARRRAKPPRDLAYLSWLPSTQDHFTWADLVEVRALLDLDGQYSRADLLDEVRDERVVREAREDDGGAPVAGRDVWATEVFQHLQWRAGVFGDVYPFVVRPGEPLRRRKRLSRSNLAYAFLLLSSNLPMLHKKARGAYAAAFEEVSSEALQRYLPAVAKVHRLHRGPRYQGKNLLNKIKAVAVDLRETFTGESRDFPTHSTGDERLDLIGWVPFGDTLRGMLIAFGQCACSVTDWRNKQDAVRAWASFMTFQASPAGFMFVPFCYRSAAGDRWARAASINQGTILVDRVRLVQLLGKKIRKAAVPFKRVAAALATRQRVA